MASGGFYPTVVALKDAAGVPLRDAAGVPLLGLALVQSGPPPLGVPAAPPFAPKRVYEPGPSR